MASIKNSYLRCANSTSLAMAASERLVGCIGDGVGGLNWIDPWRMESEALNKLVTATWFITPALMDFDLIHLFVAESDPPSLWFTCRRRMRNQVRSYMLQLYVTLHVVYIWNSWNLFLNFPCSASMFHKSRWPVSSTPTFLALPPKHSERVGHKRTRGDAGGFISIYQPFVKFAVNLPKNKYKNMELTTHNWTTILMCFTSER